MRFEGSAFSVRHTQYSLKSDYGSSINVLFIQTEIAREQKICRKILRAGTWAGVILAFVRIMKPWISADFEQGEVRAGKFLWFFRRTKPPLLIWQKRKNTLANYSPSIRSRCALFSPTHPWAAREVLKFLFIIAVPLSHQRRGFAHSSWFLVNVFRAGGVLVLRPQNLPQEELIPKSRAGEMPQVTHWSENPPGGIALVRPVLKE